MVEIGEGLYRQLEMQANKTVIVELLRRAQDHPTAIAQKDVHLSGTKSDCISSLRQAVDRGYIDDSEVYEALWEAEENGYQKILLYRPSSQLQARKLCEPARIGNALFGEDGWSYEDFPRFESKPNELTIADFRYGLPGKPNDWMLKFYGHEQLRRPLGPTVTSSLEYVGFSHVIQEIRRYRVQDIHAVHIVRWRHPDTLEFRVDITGLRSDEVFKQRLDAMWQIMAVAIDREDVLGRNIDTALTSLLDRRAEPEYADAYTIGELELVDPGSGFHKVIPSESEAFDAEPARSAILETARNEGLVPNALRVKWKRNESTPEGFPEELDTALDKTIFGPVLTIRRRTKYSDIEYVFNQLRTHSDYPPRTHAGR
jgi:hypothetical protein